MSKDRHSLKILLLQVRADVATQQEELQAFIEFSGLSPEQVDGLNCYEHMNFTPNVIDDYDALFVGGSSDASVREPARFPFVIPALKLIRYCYENNIPTLASCFGFQLAVEELGGKVILDETNKEIGMIRITLTDECQNDLLLYDYPKQFWSVSGHQERAASIPQDAKTLGLTTLCPYHIIAFKNKPFYGFQFHPEIDRKVLHDRLHRYHTRYLNEAEEMQAIIATMDRDTTLANRIIYDFVDRVILKHPCK